MRTAPQIKLVINVGRGVNTTPPRKYVTVSKIRLSSGMERLVSNVSIPITSISMPENVPPAPISKYTISTHYSVSHVHPIFPCLLMDTAINALEKSFGTPLHSNANYASKGQPLMHRQMPANVRLAVPIK